MEKSKINSQRPLGKLPYAEPTPLVNLKMGDNRSSRKTNFYIQDMKHKKHQRKVKGKTDCKS